MKLVLKFKALNKIARQLKRLADHFCNPPRPGKPTVQVVSQVQKGEKTMLKFKVKMPIFSSTDPNDNDVAVRKLTVAIPGSEPIVLDVVPVFTTDPDDPALDVNDDRFVGNAGEVVTLSLFDVDAAGNSGSATPATLELQDTIAPPAPGTFGGQVVGQTE